MSEKLPCSKTSRAPSSFSNSRYFILKKLNRESKRKQGQTEEKYISRPNKKDKTGSTQKIKIKGNKQN